LPLSFYGFQIGWEELFGFLHPKVACADGLMHSTSIILLANANRLAIRAWLHRSPNLMQLLPDVFRCKLEDHRALIEHCGYNTDLESIARNLTSSHCVIEYILDNCDKRLSCTLNCKLYTLQVMLRSCLAEHQIRSCVCLYANLLLHEESTELALALDISLAKSFANYPQIGLNRRRYFMITPSKLTTVK